MENENEKEVLVEITLTLDLNTYNEFLIDENGFYISDQDDYLLTHPFKSYLE